MSNRLNRENEIPLVCWSCPFLETHEYDDMGYLWANAFCYKGLFLPVKKESCKVKERHIAAEAAKTE